MTKTVRKKRPQGEIPVPVEIPTATEQAEQDDLAHRVRELAKTERIGLAAAAERIRLAEKKGA